MWQFLATKQNWIIQLAICHIWYIPTTLLWFLNQWWQFVVTFWGYNDHDMRIWGSYIFRDCPIMPGQFDDYSHMRVWGYEDPHMRIWIIRVQHFQGLPHHARTQLPRRTLSSLASSGSSFFLHGDYYLKGDKIIRQHLGNGILFGMHTNFLFEMGANLDYMSN